ncbi:MAG TPA: DNA polymerase I [Terriglobia bacterium]|nr:DNA polymerase I [Terriglobia bacterium]
MAEATKGEKLFLIDAMSLVFRAFYAPMQMALVSPSGMPTKAIYIFVRILKKLLKDHRPEHVAVTFDTSAPTFRDKAFEEYKANRPTFPEDLGVQLPFVRRFCRAMGLSLVEKDGFEADDVIGTLARRTDRPKYVFIVSGDEDLCQLVDDQTFLLKPGRSGSDQQTLVVPRTPKETFEEYENEHKLKIATLNGEKVREAVVGSEIELNPNLAALEAQKAKELVEKKLQRALGAFKLSQVDIKSVREIIGVEPDQVVDWLALTGDPSDNIPGARPLPGKEPQLADGEKKRSYIGPKGATELIRQFKTLEKTLESYEQVKKQSYHDALRDYQAEARLSQDLATIRTDVPMDLTISKLAPSARDMTQLTALCQELGFTKLLREFLEESPSPQEGATAGGEVSAQGQEFTSSKELKDWLAGLQAHGPLTIAAAVEGEEGFGGRLAGLGLSDGQRRATLPLDVSANAAKFLQAARPALADPRRPKSIHNSKLLRLLLAKEQVELNGVADDTLLYANLVEPLATSQSLHELALRRLGRRLENSLADAAACTRELAALLAPEVARENLTSLYDEIELPLSEVLSEVEAAGVRIDSDILAALSAQFEKELAALTREIHTLAGEPFDIDSPKQLGQILFEKLKLPGGRRLKKSGQYSTDAAVLEALREQHELPRKIFEYRTRAKLKSTYVDTLPKYINPSTGRVHTSFNQTGARTGRLSSSNPNLQNIPIGDEFGLRIRSAFVAEPGNRLISADYSQIELRVLAHLSEDPRLIESFIRDEDIHSRTAQEIFGILPALQTHDHRRMAKAINYGVIYGLSSFGLAGRTGTSKTEAQRYIDEYFHRYARVKEYLDRCVQEACDTGRVRTMFGRLRPIPEIRGGDVASRNRAEREAMNTPLQGTAADLLKLAMVKVHARLRREKLKTRMILTVHDELVFEAPEKEVKAAQHLVKEEMEGAYPMRVPLRVEIGAGLNWKEAK